MSEQMVTIEIDQATAEALKTKAGAMSLPLDAYLRRLAQDEVFLAQAPKPTLEEYDRDMDQLAAGLEGLPVLPRDFSRVDIYTDHD